MATNLDRYNQATLDALEAQGVEIAVEGDEVEIAVPLNVGFFNPDLVQQVQHAAAGGDQARAFVAARELAVGDHDVAAQKEDQTQN
jgi:hypothetical protein